MGSAIEGSSCLHSTPQVNPHCKGTAYFSITDSSAEVSSKQKTFLLKVILPCPWKCVTVESFYAPICWIVPRKKNIERHVCIYICVCILAVSLTGLLTLQVKGHFDLIAGFHQEKSCRFI